LLHPLPCTHNTTLVPRFHTPPHPPTPLCPPQAAQEREELKRQGDQLDAAITAAERDLAGLGATLGALQATNTDFNTSLRSGGPAATRELEDVR
jgi:hypothetical protein